MPRPTSESYDDLNGEQGLQILHTRFYDLLHDIPELQERFALTRVVLRLEIVLDIWGATPPTKIIHDKYEAIVTLPVDRPHEDVEAHHTLTAVVDTRNEPPDLAREEHGLPLPRAFRGQSGVTETHYVPAEDEPKYPAPPQPKPKSDLPTPATLASPTSKQVGRRRYAGWVEQDYGSLVMGERTGAEGPVIGGGKVSDAKSDVTGEITIDGKQYLGLDDADDSDITGPAPPQVDFRIATGNLKDESKVRDVVEKTIERGNKIDKAISRRSSGNPAPKPKGRK